MLPKLPIIVVWQSNTFKSLCPVQPVLIPPKYKQYDRTDLDKWLDDLKTGNELASRNDILDRL